MKRTSFISVGISCLYEYRPLFEGPKVIGEITHHQVWFHDSINYSRNLECKNVTWRWVSFHSVFTFFFPDLIPFSFHSFIAFSFGFSKQNAGSIEFMSGDWLGNCITSTALSSKTLGLLFAICFGTLSIFIVKHCTMSCEACARAAHPAAVVWSHITGN